MKIIILHGRKDPEERLNNWGFDGPTLEKVRAVHVTYLATFNVFFETPEAAKKAQEQTGWNVVDNNALEMRFEKDLLVTDEFGVDRCYYGDWEVQSQ